MMHMPRHVWLRRVVLGLGACLALAGCSDSPTAPSSGSGVFSVGLTDAPFDDAQAVLVTFSQVAIHRDTDADFVTVPFADGATARTCDLKKLETATDVLGVGTVAAGHYTQVRLVVQSAAVYFDAPSSSAACAPSIATPAGASATLDIPSGEVKLNRTFDVPVGGTTTMLLDFDGAQSIKQTGNGQYRMTPVIAVVSVE